jgi:hypothetical protein
MLIEMVDDANAKGRREIRQFPTKPQQPSNPNNAATSDNGQPTTDNAAPARAPQFRETFPHPVSYTVRLPF